MVLVQDLGQESNSKFNRSLCEGCFALPPAIGSCLRFFPHLRKQQTCLSFCQTGLLFYWGQHIIFPIIIGIEQKPFERESCV